jgi:hypothetical protein
MCGPRVIWCTAWRLDSEVFVSKAQASQQLYKIDGGLVMEMVKESRTFWGFYKWWHISLGR